MLETLFKTIKENPGMAIGTALGALGGIAGGVLLGGGSAMTAVLLAGALGLGGAALGFMGGSYVSNKIEAQQPAPLGMHQQVVTAVEPNKTAAFSFKPTPQMTDNLINELQGSLRGTPEYAQVEPYIPMARQMAPMARLVVQGEVSADSTYVTVNRAQLEVPGVQIPPIGVGNVRLPLKNGAIDENNPETRAQMQAMMRQTVQQFVPQHLQARVGGALERAVTQTTSGAASPAPAAQPASTAPAPVAAPAIVPGQPATVGFRPSDQMTDRLVTELQTELGGTKEFQQAAPYLPMARSMLPQSQVLLRGTVSRDGKSITISSARLEAPGLPNLPAVSIPNVSVPLINGRIDETHAETRAQLKVMMKSAISQYAPATLQTRAARAVDKALSRNEGIAPGTPQTELAAALHNGASGTHRYEGQSLPYNKPAGEHTV